MDAEEIRLRVGKMPLDAQERRRILMTIQCNDCALIPKVPGAGEIFADNQYRYQRMHNGIKVLEDCYYGRWMTELIRLLHGHHEPQEEWVFYELLKHVPANGTMLELGSFWAYYSLWFQNSVPNARTYMVEPDPNNLQIGRRNFALNDRSGYFFNHSIGKTSSAPEPFYCESDAITRPIPKISIDDLIEKNEIEFIDLILADIQGAELEMLNGAEKSIAEGKIRFIVISTHHHSISKDPILHQRCLRFLEEKQATILAEHNISESYSGDGLIAASFLTRDREIPAIPISKNHSSNSFFRAIEFDLAEAEDLIVSLRQRIEQLENAAGLRLQEIEALNQKVTHLESLLVERDALITRVLGSTSWKVSRPIRTLGQFFRKMRSA